jgi:hypothetical protein
MFEVALNSSMLLDQFFADLPDPVHDDIAHGHFLLRIV